MGKLATKAGVFLSKLGTNLLANKGAFSFGKEINGLVNSTQLGGIRISTDSLYTVWRNHADVFACVRELKENVGSAGYHWENVFDSNKDPDVQEVSAAEELLKSYQGTLKKLKNKLIQDVKTTGNAYVLILKNKQNKIIGLQVVDPRTLSVVTDQYGKIVRWIQRVDADTQEFQPDEIQHWKIEDDPNSPVFGLSPLEPIIWEVRTDLAAMVSNYVFFVNDAQPAAQYILDDGITDEEANRAVESIQKQLKGAENRHKSLALKGVKEIKQLSISQKDMEFHVLRRFTTEKVCAVFGVPKSILNYTDDVNYSNGREQTQKFYEGTVDPLQSDNQEFINEILFTVGIKKVRLVYNERKFDTREWVETSSRADVSMGVMTINEAREARGYQPFKASDVGEFVDKPIIYSGLGARPVSDIGIDMSSDIPPGDSNEDPAVKELRKFEEMSQRYLYGRNNKKN